MTTAMKLLSIATATAALLVASMTGALAQAPTTLTIRRTRLLLRRRLSPHRPSRASRPRRTEAWEA